jgi:hypothetical protein
VPLRVADTLGVALVDSESVPALTVAVAVTLAAEAEAAAARAIAAVVARIAVWVIAFWNIGLLVT